MTIQVDVVDKRSRGNVDTPGTRVSLENWDFSEQSVWEAKDQSKEFAYEFVFRSRLAIWYPGIKTNIK